MSLSACITAACFCLFVLSLYAYIKGEVTLSHAMDAVAWWVLFVAAVSGGDRISAIVDGLFAVVSTWLWWNSGPGNKLKKAARELGDESRQRIQALVDAITPQPAGTMRAVPRGLVL